MDSEHRRVDTHGCREGKRLYSTLLGPCGLLPRTVAGGGLLEAQLPGLLAGLGERAAVACHGLGVEGWLLGSEAQQPWIARLRGECAHGMGGHVCTQKSGACARCACSGGTMPRGLASMPQYFQV